MDMPVYQCHKKVQAVKLRGVLTNYDKDNTIIGYFLVPQDRQYSPIEVTKEWIDKHEPYTVGGYYVVYEDGYASYSPAKAFEDGYTLIEEQ